MCRSKRYKNCEGITLKISLEVNIWKCDVEGEWRVWPDTKKLEQCRFITIGKVMKQVRGEVWGMSMILKVSIQWELKEKLYSTADRTVVVSSVNTMLGGVAARVRRYISSYIYNI